MVTTLAPTLFTTFATSSLVIMGQDFMLVNLDRNERVDIGKLGASYLDTELSAYLCNQNPEHSWAGDRLILLGDYSWDIPAGIEEDYDPEYGCAYVGPSDSTMPQDCHDSYDKSKALRNICTREYIRSDLFPGERTLLANLAA